MKHIVMFRKNIRPLKKNPPVSIHAEGTVCKLTPTRRPTGSQADAVPSPSGFAAILHRPVRNVAPCRTPLPSPAATAIALPAGSNILLAVTLPRENALGSFQRRILMIFLCLPRSRGKMEIVRRALAQAAAPPEKAKEALVRPGCDHPVLPPTLSVFHVFGLSRRERTMKTPNPIHIPGNAVIEEVGIDCMNEIEDHRIAGSVFVQYRKAVLNEKGEETDSIVLRFDLPVCIYNSARHPDLKALTVLEIEELFCKEVESVLEKLPRPFTANTKSDATDG